MARESSSYCVAGLLYLSIVLTSAVSTVVRSSTASTTSSTTNTTTSTWHHSTNTSMLVMNAASSFMFSSSVNMTLPATASISPTITSAYSTANSVTVNMSTPEAELGSGETPSDMLVPDTASTTTPITLLSLTPSTSPPPTTTSQTSPRTTSETSSSPTLASLGQWVGVGVAAAVMLALIGVAAILSVCVLYKLCSRKKANKVHVGVRRQRKSPLRKLSSSSNKKLMESALGEIHEVQETAAGNESLFEHLTEAQLSSFPASSLPSYVEQLHDEDSYMAEEEYEDVKDLDPPASCEQASLTCNELRNRYTNILPRDHTRVVLSTIPKVAGSDYINANFIGGFTHSREYIATQGPLPSTCPDFWRMIWEYNVHIIVMVTNVEENGMVKCHQYWPHQGMGQYGNMVVVNESQVLYPEFVVRELTLSMSSKNKKQSQAGASKSVTQYHFTVWPDFGVPKEASAMIKFVKRVRRAISPSDGPVVTHCSAGVGRTGTYIAVDILTQQLSKGGPVNVQEVVCRMRAQRGLMVQTPAQYLFIYDSILYYHLYGCMEVEGDSLEAHIEALDTPTEDGDTPLSKEFQHVITVQMSTDCLFSAALDDDNKDKNRDSNNIPVDNNRVVLEDLGSGKDYINASFITGYYNRREFITTQHPLPSTIGDFWSMVWQRDIKTIITIGPLADKQDGYWPEVSSEPRSFDNGVRVSLVESEWMEEAGLIIRELNVHSVENTKEVLAVKQFHLQLWPVDGAPTEATPTIELIEHSREHWRETGFNLILIHTATGVKAEAAGVYCALCVLFRQLDVEDYVDVFSAVSKLRKQRPGVLTSKDYYRFIYSVLEARQNEQ